MTPYQVQLPQFRNKNYDSNIFHLLLHEHIHTLNQNQYKNILFVEEFASQVLLFIFLSQLFVYELSKNLPHFRVLA